jgi:GT2 family glycosyltransferase
MAIHESVWREIGYFRSEPKLLGFEDTLFFRAAELAGIKMITTGSSWVHHYGSVTQKLLKEELGIHSSQGLGDRYNYRLLGDSWFTRKRRKAAKLKRLSGYRSQEVSLHGMSIHGLRKSGKFAWI